MLINPKFLFIFSRGFKILGEHTTCNDYSDVPWFGCKERNASKCPQAQMGSIAPLNCFKHSNEYLALHTWKINLTNKYKPVKMEFGRASAWDLI